MVVLWDVGYGHDTRSLHKNAMVVDPQLSLGVVFL